MNNNFEFVGFVPNEENTNYAKIIYERIENIAPYDSGITAEIFKRPESYLCSIRVSTNYKIFNAKAENKDFGTALKEAYRIVSDKIERWKMRRNFNEFGMGLYSYKF